MSCSLVLFINNEFSEQRDGIFKLEPKEEEIVTLVGFWGGGSRSNGTLNVSYYKEYLQELEVYQEGRG